MGLPVPECAGGQDFAPRATSSRSPDAGQCFEVHLASGVPKPDRLRPCTLRAKWRGRDLGDGVFPATRISREQMGAQRVGAPAPGTGRGSWYLLAYQATKAKPSSILCLMTYAQSCSAGSVGPSRHRAEPLSAVRAVFPKERGGEKGGRK